MCLLFVSQMRVRFVASVWACASLELFVWFFQFLVLIFLYLIISLCLLQWNTCKTKINYLTLDVFSYTDFFLVSKAVQLGFITNNILIYINYGLNFSNSKKSRCLQYIFFLFSRQNSLKFFVFGMLEMFSKSLIIMNFYLIFIYIYDFLLIFFVA